GIGKITIPAKNLFIGAIFNAIINYVLTGLPQFGIRGAALGTVTGFAIASILNIFYVKKWAKINFDFKKLIIKPLIAVLIMAITVLSNFEIIKIISKYHFNYYNETLNTFLVIFIGIIVYFLSLLLLKEIKYNDLILIPKLGKKIANFLLKLNLLTK
ncbi:MAG: polysaccharide biosynthesis C-terminal domain-containing protein, partial [Bacillota bacterium]